MNTTQLLFSGGIAGGVLLIALTGQGEATLLAALTAAATAVLLTPGRPGPRRLHPPGLRPGGPRPLPPAAPRPLPSTGRRSLPPAGRRSLPAAGPQLLSPAGRRPLSTDLPPAPGERLATAYRQWRGYLTPHPVPPRSRRLHRLAAVLAALGCLALLPLPWSAVPAVLVYLLTPACLSRLEPSTTRDRAARIAADLPLTVDLLAACLRAGRPPQAAVAAVAQSLDGPLSALLTEVEARLALGTDPAEAWSVLRTEPSCAPLVRAVQRALRSGAPLARTLEAQSADLREFRRWTADEQSRAVETRSVLPLGLCFLPAFVLLGVVPTIASTLTDVFTDLTP